MNDASLKALMGSLTEKARPQTASVTFKAEPVKEALTKLKDHYTLDDLSS